MKKQDYSNHVQYYVPHHFIFYPLLLALTGTCFYMASKHPDQQFIWIAFAVVFCLIGWLSFMVRQHYALNNQDRIVRLEMRLRYYRLTHEKFEAIENKLTIGQIAALRFASDMELPFLVENAVNKNLSPKAIKKSIIEWTPDHMRV